jgi:hypothetical protein
VIWEAVMPRWTVVATKRMEDQPFDIVLKALVPDELLDRQGRFMDVPWVTAEHFGKIFHAVASAQKCLRDAYALIQEDPVYGSIGSEDKKRQYKWGAHKLFNCRRVELDPQFWSPFTREQHASLVDAVKKTLGGLCGSHGDLIIKVGFGGIFGQSGISDKFLKVCRGQTMEGFVGDHKFGRKQHGATLPTYGDKCFAVGGWCMKGDIHLGERFLDNSGEECEEDAVADLVHEATHKFADLQDLAYFDTDKGTQLEPDWGVLGMPELMLTNADSVAQFCLLVTGLYWWEVQDRDVSGWGSDLYA